MRAKNPYGVTLRIGHDLDGNLGNWERATREALSKHLNRPELMNAPPVSQWHGWRDWDITDEQFYIDYKTLLAEGVLQNLEVFPGQLEFMATCADRGHENYIITNRFIGLEDRMSQFDTFEWINKNFASVQIDGVVISSNKSIIPTDIFYDDSTDNIDDLLAHGCPYPVLIDAAYNRERTDLDPIRCPNTASDKMRIVLDVEQIMSQFQNPLENMSTEDLISNPIFSAIAEAAAAMERQDVDPESPEGQAAMARAWEEVQSTGNSLNNKLRLK